MRAETTFDQAPHRPPTPTEGIAIAHGGAERALRIVTETEAPPRRIVLVASAGGHWLELCRLAEAFRDFDCQFVCTTEGQMAPIGDRPVLVVADGSRRRMLSLIGTATTMARLLRGFRPEIVVSTGAAPGAVALTVARCMGAHTIWIESISCRDAPSMSGRFVRRVADLFLTQWPHMAAKHPAMRYFGRVL